MSKKRQKNKAVEMLKILLIFFIVVFVILGILIVSISNLKGNENKKLSETQVEADKEREEAEKNINTENDVIIQKLSNMDEKERMEYYASRFISAIEQKEYEQAYDMLYDEFKQNYFPTEEEFESYAKKTFSSMVSLTQTNFERSGQNYVIFATLSNPLSSSKEEREIRIIVKENALNDYVLSFSVI